ncbi:hypothetical protein VTJ04DRAFT_5953 [Mycothermus thermophilus]|uniref:uncharacterized protein n=1 Tax=Humicola insolens TaxID=85995 RepID=UPI0037423BB9
MPSLTRCFTPARLWHLAIVLQIAGSQFGIPEERLSASGFQPRPHQPVIPTPTCGHGACAKRAFALLPQRLIRLGRLVCAFPGVFAIARGESGEFVHYCELLLTRLVGTLACIWKQTHF